MKNISSHLRDMIALADSHRRASRWHDAIKIYAQVNLIHANFAAIKQNLSLCYFATAQFQLANQLCREAILLDSQLWQAHILLAKCHRKMGEPLQAETQFRSVLKKDPLHGEARLGLADLALNEFGDPLGATALVEPLIALPEFSQDAKLTKLMSSLYDRDIGSIELNQQIIQFSKQTLQIPSSELPRYQHKVHQRQANRKRIGILSPLLCVSPVYFLTIAFFKSLAQGCDLIFFNRGTQYDWATMAFEEIASSWFNVAPLSAIELAKFLYDKQLDVIYDLGGWMDPIGLRALSVKPAKTQFKWIGGQSVTTGLDCFDGWIGDSWQSPMTAQPLYTEKLINSVEDYAQYTPPPYLPKQASRKIEAWCIFANPAKVSRAFLKKISELPGKKCFIHRQFKYDQIRERIESILKPKEVEYLCPQTHLEALEMLNRHAKVLDTFPYSSGLTAREAMAMGTQIEVLSVGMLFCERHTARYQS